MRDRARSFEESKKVRILDGRAPVRAKVEQVIEAVERVPRYLRCARVKASVTRIAWLGYVQRVASVFPSLGASAPNIGPG